MPNTDSFYQTAKLTGKGANLPSVALGEGGFLFNSNHKVTKTQSCILLLKISVFCVICG